MLQSIFSMALAIFLLLILVSKVHSVDWGTGNRISAAFIARKSGETVTFGDPLRGGDSSAVQDDINYSIRFINSTYGAYSALLYDGTVRCWGDPEFGGNSTELNEQLEQVVEISTTGYAFAARKQDGSVVAWGNPLYGGSTASVEESLVNITHIFANEEAFAAVSLTNEVVVWGAFSHGADIYRVHFPAPILHIYSTRWAFAALMDGGGVSMWGSLQGGGQANELEANLTSGVVHISSTMHAFAALKGDGSVIAWGHPDYGGDASAVYHLLGRGVKKLHSTEFAFAAIVQVGYSSEVVLVTWGDPLYGGAASGAVHTALSSGVNEIVASAAAFAALTNNGGVVVWGDEGNMTNLAEVQSFIQSSVRKIYSTERAFAAVSYNDNKVYCFGPAEYGGNNTGVPTGYIYSMSSNSRAFAAVMYTGTNQGYQYGSNRVYSWGDPAYGGDTSNGTVRTELDDGYYNTILGTGRYDQNYYSYALPSLAPVPYPTDAPVNDPTGMPAFGDGVYQSAPTYTVSNGFAFVLHDIYAGYTYAYGESSYGGNTTYAQPFVNYVVAPSRFAYASMHIGENYVYRLKAWGASASIVNLPNITFDNPYVTIVATESAFAVISSGKVYAFGSKHGGGVYNETDRCSTPECMDQTQTIVASACAFASVSYYNTLYVWGNRNCGGELPAEVANEVVAQGGAYRVTATRESFAVITMSGGVYAWGKSDAVPDTQTQLLLQSGVDWVTASRSVFVAYKADTTVVVWGYGPFGGDTTSVASQLSTGVLVVVHTFTAMAALLVDYTVVAWGKSSGGGDATAVQSDLVDVQSIKGNSKAFAALTTSGRVVTWGRAAYGGTIPANKLALLQSEVIALYSTDRAFAALKSNGTLVVWGQAGHGGDPSPEVMQLLSVGVHTVCANDVAFSAVTVEGKVVAWGHPVSVPVGGVVFADAALSGSSPLACK